jgi:hypothetical protein
LGAQTSRTEQYLTMGKVGMQPVPNPAEARSVSSDDGWPGPGRQHAVQQCTERIELLRRPGSDQARESGHRASRQSRSVASRKLTGLASVADVGLAHHSEKLRPDSRRSMVKNRPFAHRPR